MPNNPSLESLRRIVSGARSDLQKLRSISSVLTEKVASLKGRKEFRAEFIAGEVSKLRADANQSVSDYMRRSDIFEPFTSRVLGPDYWNVPAFLSRALVVSDPILLVASEGRNTTEIMKALLNLQRQTNLLLSLPRLTVDALATVAETAHTASDWQTLALVHAEAGFRGATDERAKVLEIGITSSTIDEVQQGKELVAEAKQLHEFLGYSLRSIQSGEEDIGLRYEAAQAIADQRRAQREQDRMQAA